MNSAPRYSDLSALGLPGIDMFENLEIVASQPVSLAKSQNKPALIYADAKQVKIRQRFDHLHHRAEASMKFSQYRGKGFVLARQELRGSLKIDSSPRKCISRRALILNQHKADGRIAAQVLRVLRQFAEKKIDLPVKPDKRRIAGFRSMIITLRGDLRA